VPIKVNDDRAEEMRNDYKILFVSPAIPQSIPMYKSLGFRIIQVPMVTAELGL
jgi:hypothetical protein